MTILCEGEVAICPKPAPKRYLLSQPRSDAGGTVKTFCAGHHWLQSEVDCIINTLIVPTALCKSTFGILFYLIQYFDRLTILFLPWPGQDRAVLSGLKFTRKCISPSNLRWGGVLVSGPLHAGAKTRISAQSFSYEKICNCRGQEEGRTKALYMTVYWQFWLFSYWPAAQLPHHLHSMGLNTLNGIIWDTPPQLQGVG